MIGALWTGISGLAGQQTALDNESHNIANVNTIGYKASRISFADQLYQDKIGKGTKVLDAEKLFTQGNLKLTGVAYDLAISGDGFFSVKNERASGTAETFFTRAGNFRMGDDGTLQDGAGNKVQGWGMSAIDPDSDVLSTNPNVNVFTTDFTKLVSSKVISHSNYVETVTAKTTDYAASAQADSESIYTGSGLKSKSSKIADIEELVASYTTWLQKYQDDPESTSATAKSQVSQIKFEGDELNNEGDQIYVYINGNKITQSYVSVIATEDINNDGFGPSSSSYAQSQDNIAASKIATYKALADQISQIPGLAAYTVTDENSTLGTSGTFESTDTFTKTTDAPADGKQNALRGMIQIEGLIPGESFEITEVATVSGTSTYQGVVNSTGSNLQALQGSGLGALQSARDALAQAVTGSQRDVFTAEDLNLGNVDLEGGSLAGEEYTMEFVIYDKDTQQNVSVGPISLNQINSIDDIVDALPNGGTTYSPAAATLFNKYFTAENINGNLVVSTNSSNYDVEFSTTLTAGSKGFESSRSTDGQSREIATFDNSFMPTPDGVKDYSLEFSYAVNAPVDNGLNTSDVQIDISEMTFRPTDYSFSFTFEDTNNTISRGGGNQVIDIEIEQATSQTDLANKIDAQLTAMGLNDEFDVSFIPPTAKMDTITFENKSMPDGEEISLTINEVDYTVRSDSGQGVGTPLIAGNTIYVNPTDLNTVPGTGIAEAFDALLTPTITNMTINQSANTLELTHTGEATGPTIVTNTPIDNDLTAGTVNTPAVATSSEMDEIVVTALADTESFIVNVGGQAYEVRNDYLGTASAATNLTVLDGNPATVAQITAALKTMIDADSANNGTDGNAVDASPNLTITAGVLGGALTGVSATNNAIAATINNTPEVAGNPGSDAIQVVALDDKDSFEITLNAITYTIQVDLEGTAGTLGTTRTVTSILTAEQAALALKELIDDDNSNNLSDGAAVTDGNGLLTLSEEDIGESLVMGAVTHRDIIIASAVETTPYSPSPLIQIQNVDPAGAEAISSVELNAIMPSVYPPVNIDTKSSLTNTISLDFSGVTDFSKEFEFDLSFVDADLTLGGGNQQLTYRASGTSIAAIATDLNNQLGGELTAIENPVGMIEITNGDSGIISSASADALNTDSLLQIDDAVDVNDLATQINAVYGPAQNGPLIASVDTEGNLKITLADADSGGGDSDLMISLKETSSNLILEKNADHSGREGAGAEFIEIINKIDQVASQGGLQLRLDTLGISDSAFGEFKVDSSGLITMKQDGAEFAIGQVSIALFNNTRGLDPYGDNLMQKTTNSGEPIYNTNNERTANIEGGTLELSTADLSESLVNLMVFQRAFEANAKTITTSDALLNTLINLKR